jgi:RHS repeat-associated protein
MMSIGIRRLVLCLLCCIGLWCWTSAAEAAETPPAGEEASPLNSTFVVPGSPVEGEQIRAQEEAAAASPEAVAERESSQTAFAGLNAEKAEQVAAEAFPVMVSEPAGGPPPLPEGEKITEYSSNNTALVDLGNGRHGAIESLAPMAIETPHGRLPIDLNLSAGLKGFYATTPAIDVEIPRRIASGITLADTGVSLTPVDGSGDPLVGSEGGIVGVSVLYANTQEDQDTLVKPTTLGFEADTLLRSVHSPEQLYFRISLPEGAKLEVASDSGAVTVVKEGVVLALISAPSARDATGRVVPVTMSVSSNTLVLRVSHHYDEYTYPIAVDPTVTDSAYLTGVYNGYDENWLFYNAAGPKIGGSWEVGENHSNDGMYLGGSGPFAQGEWAYFYYITKGASQIYSWHAKTESWTNGTENDAELYIYSEKGEEGTRTLLPRNGTTETTVCALSGCAVPSSIESGRGANGAFFEAYAELSGTFPFAYHARETSVSIVQYQGPSASVDTSDQYIAGYDYNGKGENVWITGLNPLYSGGTWVSKYNGMLGFEGSDPGVGVDRLGYYSSSEPSWGTGSASYGIVGKCKGTVQCNECVGQHCPVSEPLTKSVWFLPEGEDPVEDTAYDGLGMTATAKTTVKIDNAAPHNITLSGLPAGNEVGDGQSAELKLVASATDGSGSLRSSGVASLALSVDGNPFGNASGSCSPGECTATSNAWVLNTQEYPAGKHTFTVTATDKAGNVTTQNFTLTIHHASPVSMGPGSVNPLTGEFSMGATDVSVSGPGAAMTVSRSYSSRHLTAGAEGPLGPLWSMSVGGEQSITKLPNGSVVLTNSSGQQATFTSSGGKKFLAPPGDASLTLTETTINSVAAFQLKSGTTVTTFERPSGGSETLWMPAITEGNAGTNASTFTFQTAEVEGKKITEPTEELAPIPAGVSCSPTLTRGCRALTFNYATSTTAKGESASEWGDYTGRLTRVYLTAWNPAKSEMTTNTIAQYAYDTKGRLRAVWNPLISPALKTDYGYDSEGHLSAIVPPGEEPWALTYGTTTGDSNTGRLIKAMRPSVVTPLWSGSAPKNTELPKLSGSPIIGIRMAVSNGTWSNSPVTYGYQWEDCNGEGKECSVIPGATNSNYTPVASDAGHTLVAQVFAISGGGTTVAVTAASRTADALEVAEYSLPAKSMPYGITKGSDGNVWFTDLNTSKIGKITTAGAVTEYTSGATPVAITEGSDLNLWFADLLTSKIGKSTTAGTVTEYALPSGSIPEGVTKGPDGNVWFTNSETSKIGKITTGGAVTEYALPSGSKPWGITAGPDGNLWYTNAHTSKIGKITTTGVITEYALPAGSEPKGITAGPDGNVWFTAVNKVGKITTTGVITEYSLPAGSGPMGITTGPESTVWFTENTTSKVGKITTAGGITEYTLPAGSEPKGIVKGSDGNLWVTEQGTSKIAKLNPTPTISEGEQHTPNAGWTVEYRVPVSGSSAPYEMGTKEVETWGQNDRPAEATAIFPPDEPQEWPASDYKRASIEYFDTHDRVVNAAAPGGGVATSEYNENNDVVRTLSPSNRQSALGEGSKSSEASKLLDNESTYNSDGSELLSTLGPQHTVKLSTGSQVQARKTAHYYYDEGAPSEGGPYNLVTKTTTAALVGSEEADKHTVVTSYSGQNNLGWMLRKPTSTTTDPSGLKIVHTVIYNSQTGNVAETRTPGAGPEAEETSKLVRTFGSFGSSGLPLSKPADIAIDSNSRIWIADTENNRIQKLSATGEYTTAFGTEGTGTGQFKKPHGVVVSNEKVWVTDTENNRLQEFSYTGTYQRTVGSAGSGNGQLRQPQGIATDKEGHIWVADTGNYRVEEFSAEGAFIRTFGSLGEGNSQFILPTGIAVDSSGHVWVVDKLLNKVKEFSSTGEFIRVFGTSGTGNGQLSTPQGIAIDQENHVWVADTGNNRMQEFSSEGTYMAQFGTEGAGNGKFKAPAALALDKENHAWIADSGNNRAQELTTTGTYVRQYPSAAAGLKFNKPSGIASATGKILWIADTENNRLQETTTEGTYLRSIGAEGTGNGQFKNPRSVTVDKEGHVWVVDSGNHRVQELSSEGAFIRAFGSQGEGNSQFEEPAGIATDPSGHVWVVDKTLSKVKEFSSTGEYIRTVGSIGSGNGQFFWPQGIATDKEGHIWVADTGNSRVQELSSTGTYITQFGTHGSAAGQFSEPRALTVGEEGNVWVDDTGNTRLQELTATGNYLQQITGNPQFKESAALAIDSAKNINVADTGNADIQEWTPGNANHEALGSGGVHGTQSIYYSSATNPNHANCGEHPEWANLPCQVQPAQQPGGIGNLPVATYTYNIWDEVEVTTQVANGATRTTTTTFDADGRPKTNLVSSTIGTSAPAVSDEYNESTGAIEKLNTSVEGKTETITSTLNKLGELESYTDANENISTFAYDIDGRPETVSDGKGTQTFSYDPTTGYVNKLVDSAAGTFTATRNIEGELLNESYSNGMSANYSYDATGEAIGLEYVKTTHCTEKCAWFSDRVVPSIYGQWLSQTSTLSSQGYKYDGAGRLIEVQDTPAGEGCTTRLYGYEEDTNRTSVTARQPGNEGKCATEGGSNEAHTYDEADRLSDTGITYDAFGNITKLPATDAGGSELTSSFYTNNQLASQTQNGETIGYYLDPAGRTHETASTGKTSSDVISHYAGAGDAPAWTVEEPSGRWTRNISGIEGSLVAIQTNGETPVLQLANLHGDIIATASLSETEAKPVSTNDTTEYGVPRTSAPPKYSWLGAAELGSELPSGQIAMGARSYVPQLGRYLQDDPVPGGSANAYAYTFGDPVNTSDPGGESTGTPPGWAIGAGAQVAEEAVARRAAEEAAARAEAERKIAEEEAAAAAYWAYWNSYSWVPSEAAGGMAEEEGGEEEAGGGDPVAHAADVIVCGGTPDYPHISTYAKRKGLKRVNVHFGVACSAPMATLRIRVSLYWNHKLVSESGYVENHGSVWIKTSTSAPCRSGLYQAWSNAIGVPPGGEIQVVNHGSAWGTPIGIKC